MPSYLSPGVYVEEVDSGSRPIEGVGTAVAAFVGIAERGRANAPVLVGNWSEFTREFGEFLPEAFLAHAVYGYFQNGGGACYVVRVGADGADGPAPDGQVAGDARAVRGAGSPALGARGPRQLPAAPSAATGRLRFVAVDPATPAGRLSVEITEPGGDPAPAESFRVLVRRGGEVVEEFDPATVTRGKQNVVTLVNQSSTTVRVEELPGRGAPERPAVGTVLALAAPAGAAAAPDRPLTAEDFVGDAAERTGFGGLEAVDEVTMLCVPDLMSAYQQGTIDLETVQAVQLGMIAHCELMGDRMAVLDPPPGLNAQQVREWRLDRAGYDSRYAALYWPWIRSLGPSDGSPVVLPPSGHVAGVWGRSDDARGVHKAPANEVLRGAIGLTTQITRTEHGLLNPTGINCLRSFPGAGIRVFGARTLSSDPAWRYLNVRRLFNYLEESILAGTQWVVFEPNDDALWARIRRTVSAFLVNEWRRGALFGLTPDEAFYVKCDRETNPAEGIDAGQVVCEVGVAPVRPAEFVVFRLAQFSGGAGLVSE